jgi:hypothetical protein
MVQRIYIDTSVVGGFFDEEFKDPTQRLFKRLENDEVKFVIGLTRIGVNSSTNIR